MILTLSGWESPRRGGGTRCFQSQASKVPPAPAAPTAPSRPGDEHSGAASPCPPRRSAATPHRLLRYRRAGRDPRARPAPAWPRAPALHVLGAAAGAAGAAAPGSALAPASAASCNVADLFTIKI